MNNKASTAYIALGSNLNDPVQQIHTALTALTALPQSSLIKYSRFYRNPPLGNIVQPDFINAVAAIKTTLSAEQLLHELQRIEIQQGRKREIHWGPRIIDLDLLLYDNLSINLPYLQIPHPELHKRNFVLYPLAEITPDLILPTGIPLTTLLTQHSNTVLEAVV